MYVLHIMGLRGAAEIVAGSQTDPWVARRVQDSSEHAEDGVVDQCVEDQCVEDQRVEDRGYAEAEQQKEEGILIDSFEDAAEGAIYLRCTAAGQTNYLKEEVVMKSGLLKVLLETKGQARLPLSVSHFQCWHAVAQQDIASPDLQKLANAAQVLLLALL